MRSRKASAAFFDLDNTLIQGSSLYYFFKGLVDFKLVSKKQILHFAFENFREFISGSVEMVGIIG
jgi:phosphoserine phosphatase